MEDVEIKLILNKSYWNKKKVLITGHTGFKGAWLSLILLNLGAKVIGVSNKNLVTKPSLFYELKLKDKIDHNIFDIRNKKKIHNLINDRKPDIIFHFAAISIVKENFLNPIDSYTTNFNGTLNLLESLRGYNKTINLIISTTDKVYLNENTNIQFFDESKPLGSNDTYALSKVMVEQVSKSYSLKYFKNSNVKVLTVRAGNVIGGGDWASERLIPDLIRSHFLKKQLFIRNIDYVRPWQHVLEALTGYMRLAEKIEKSNKFYDCYNLGPLSKKVNSVRDVINIINKKINLNIKFKILKLKKFDEDPILLLNSEKMRKTLKLESKYEFEKTIKNTIHWYIDFYNGENAIDICNKNLEDYGII